ncbi:MAG: HPP family protein [Proteobacteria bacterium]|nr:HPP family protein [Pseudomonadota bacterium]
MKLMTKKGALLDMMIASMGASIAIAVLLWSQTMTNAIWIMGSFGASCLLLFAFPSAPFAQPKNVIAGHFIGSLSGLICLTLLGDAWWVVAIAVGLSVFLMLLTNSVHPPASANPLIVIALHANWDYLLFPTLMGAVMLVVVAYGYNALNSRIKNR